MIRNHRVLPLLIIFLFTILCMAKPVPIAGRYMVSPVLRFDKRQNCPAGVTYYPIPWSHFHRTLIAVIKWQDFQLGVSPCV